MKRVYDTTDLIGLHTVFGPAIRVLDSLWLDIVGHELHILHGLDGKHMRFSRHYQGCAIDVRTWNDPTDRTSGQISGPDRDSLIAQIKQVLPSYFWVLEHFDKHGKPTHLHIAFKPENGAWTKT